MQQTKTLDAICTSLGFRFLGIIAAQDPHDQTDCQIALIGHVGEEFWPLFTAAPEYQDGKPDPLDRYCRRVLTDHAPEKARLIMPNDQPYPPFQSWAQSLGTLHPSPLGVLIHQEYGLWSAFRGAWRFPAQTFALPETIQTPSPCATCADKPCLSACPITAFTEQGFDSYSCRAYLTAQPNACIAHQCQARLACPIGAEYRYLQDVGPFFLKKFARIA